MSLLDQTTKNKHTKSKTHHALDVILFVLFSDKIQISQTQTMNKPDQTATPNNHTKQQHNKTNQLCKMSWFASSVNRTRINCLEGSYLNHWTKDAFHDPTTFDTNKNNSSSPTQINSIAAHEIKTSNKTRHNIQQTSCHCK